VTGSFANSSIAFSRDNVDDPVHPTGRIDSIAGQLELVGRGQGLSQVLNVLSSDSFGARMSECLYDCAADAPCCCHVAGRGPLQDYLLAPDSHLMRRTICQEDDLGRNMFGQSEQIRGIGTGGLQT